jgi:hypothetical protein
MKKQSSGSSAAVADKHPEKRLKAAYAKFEEDRLQEMKEEMPGLKLSQYKEKIFREVRTINSRLD